MNNKIKTYRVKVFEEYYITGMTVEAASPEEAAEIAAKRLAEDPAFVDVEVDVALEVYQSSLEQDTLLFDDAIRIG